MFTVELKGNEEVEIYLDADALSSLSKRLRSLEKGKTDHIHLMSESWGLGDLTEERQGKETTLIHHLKILIRS